MGELMIRPKSLVYIKLSGKPLGLKGEWESQNKAKVRVWIDSFPVGHKHHKDEVMGKEEIPSGHRARWAQQRLDGAELGRLMEIHVIASI